jgi:hypothetical protein
MGLLDRLKGILSGGAGSSGDGDALYYYVRCSRCDETIKARVDLRNDLSGDFAGNDMPSGYFYRKVLIGRGRCFQPIEVTMSFDARRNLLSREVSGGEFVTEEDYYAQTPGEGRAS